MSKSEKHTMTIIIFLIIVYTMPRAWTGYGSSHTTQDSQTDSMDLIFPTIEVDTFSDPDCLNPITSVNWGVIEAGGTSTSTIYLLNNGNVDTVVYLESHNWVPYETSNYMVLSWDYDGTSLAPGEIRAINVFLHVSSDCPELEVFKFELIIVGS